MNSILKNLIAAACAALLAGTATAQTLPPLISADEFLSGQYDMMPIRAQCIVRDAFRDEINPDYIYLVLLWDGEIIYAAFPADDITDETITSFLGAGIIATGTPIPRLYGQREKLGRNLQIQSSNAIVIHRKPATDIFSVPDVTRLEGTDPSELQHRDRHGFSGIVLAVWKKNNVLLLGKGTAGKDELVIARLATDNVPKYGEHIYVSGFPGTDLHHYTLSRAWWTRTREKPAPPEEAAQSSARTLTTDTEGRPRFRFDMHGRPVRLRGIVRTTVDEDGLFMIENEGLLVPVYASAALEKTAEMEIGCTIEVVGTCVMDIEDWRANSVFPQIHRFLLVTRTPSDIQIVAWPPWWTTERILWVIGALLGGIIAILLWNAALSRSAARKGRELYVCR